MILFSQSNRSSLSDHPLIHKLADSPSGLMGCVSDWHEEDLAIPYAEMEEWALSV